jgi:hypothetical protein
MSKMTKPEGSRNIKFIIEQMCLQLESSSGFGQSRSNMRSR